MQSQAQYAGLPMPGGPTPPQLYPPPGQYTYPAAIALPPSHNGALRYPLPPQQPGRPMSSARHKKEIKRRTKTGCLTCRKRRIKCDEGQPSCRNCQKSKRQCLGYDPIFKQQPSPANIQPAPSSTSTSNTTSTAAAGTTKSASAPSPSNSYFTRHQLSGFVAPPAPSTLVTEPHFEYNASLDPALATVAHSRPMARPSYAPLQAQRKVKAIAMDDLFSLNGIPPRSALETKAPLFDIEQFYKLHYAIGLDAFFDTKWYTIQGWTGLLQDAPLLDFVAQVAEQFKHRVDDPNRNALNSLEAKLVWKLATMPRAAASDPSDAFLHSLLPRIATIENLLTGQFLPPDQIPHRPAPPPAELGQDPSESPEEYQQDLFWHSLGSFVSLRDDSANPTVQKDVVDIMASIRGTLNMTENRDVLYSIAVLRHVGGRMPDFHPSRHLVVSNNDADDPVNKLKVAHSFVEAEEQRGMTQVIQRVCSMAMRSCALSKQTAPDP